MEAIEHLEPNEIFVFGSNLAGRHGKGAALQARQWGAQYGKGEGLAGQTYAIPTKDRNLRVLPLSDIRECVQRFLRFASIRPDLRFLVTRIGCGLAGYDESQIAPFFRGAGENVSLPASFLPLM